MNPWVLSPFTPGWYTGMHCRKRQVRCATLTIGELEERVFEGETRARGCSCWDKAQACFPKLPPSPVMRLTHRKDWTALSWQKARFPVLADSHSINLGAEALSCLQKKGSFPPMPFSESQLDFRYLVFKCLVPSQLPTNMLYINFLDLVLVTKFMKPGNLYF